MNTTISARNCAGRTPLSLAHVLSLCGVIGLAGCASEPVSHVVSAPPPAPPVATHTTVIAAPQPAPAAPTVTTIPSPVGASSIIVTQAPPAAQQEVPTSRPSRDHVWVPGYWTWRNGTYQWMAGHWEVPPTNGAVWVPPRWQPEGTSWRFYEGYWD